MVVIMHESCMDVCAEVLKTWSFKPGIITMKIRWWNLGYTGNPWCIDPTPQTIEIKAEDRSKWKNITHAFEVARKKPGVPL